MALRDDWFKRMTSQLGAILARATGARQKSDFDQALAATRTSTAELLGLPREVLDSVNPAGTAMVLREARKADAYVQLLEADAQTFEAMGRADEAATLRARARDVRAAVSFR